MNTKQLFGIIGSIILFIGVFMPSIRVPTLGNMNYYFFTERLIGFQYGKGAGMIVLILASISLVLALAKKCNGLWFTGFGSLGIMFFTFINVQITMSQFKAEMESEYTGDSQRKSICPQ